MKRTFNILSLILIISVMTSLLTGCNSLTGGGSGLAGNTQSTSGKVVPHLDDQNKVDVLVPEKGGQVSLTLANGVAFTLDIPDGALISDQEIVITPISSIDGMLLSGGLIAGVQLEPEGTELLTTSTLTITVPKGYNLKQMVGIAYHGQGDGFHLIPATGDGKTITLPILSFSGYGAASGTDNSINQQAAQPTSSQTDSDQQQLDNAIHKYIDTGDSSQVVQLLIDQFDNHIKPDLQAATTDDSQIDTAGQAYLIWGKGIALLGLEDKVGNRIIVGDDLLIKGLRNAFDQAFNRCIANQDVTEVFKMHKRLRELDLFGDQQYTLETKQNKLQECATFQLSFKSSLTWKMKTSMNIQAVVSGTAILHQNGGIMDPYQGSGTLNFESFTVDFTGTGNNLNNYCHIDTADSGGKVDVEGKIYTENGNTQDWQWRFSLALKPSGMNQSLPKWKCDQGATQFTINVTPNLPLWQDGFDILHQDRKISIGSLIDAYLFGRDFTSGTGNQVGHLELHSSKDEDQDTVEEDLTLDMIGAPGAK